MSETTTTTAACWHCHAEVDDLQFHNGHDICTRCLCECKECGGILLREAALVIDGESYCGECIVVCDSCGAYTSKNDLEKVRDSDSRTWDAVCPSCAETCYPCDDCGDPIHGDLTEVYWDRCVCNRCLHHYAYCDNCDAWYHEDDDSHSQCHIDTRNQSSRAQIGAQTAQFSLRTIGVEIETGAGATDYDFQEDFARRFGRWGYKLDSSLNEGGMELVSPPLGGSEIAMQIPGVYQLLRNWDVDMRDHSAGCHIHVDYRDARAFLVKQDLAGNEKPTDCFVLWGNQMDKVVRRLVSRSRAEHNYYCAANFGLRYDDDGNATLCKKINGTGYAAIAVRRETIEFRIWSVTGSADTTLARVELCQKSVDYLSRWLHAKNPKTRLMYERRLNRCVSRFMQGSFAPLAKLFRLTDDCIEEFREIYAERIQDRYDDLEYDKNNQEEP
jgi:hypothetical protein